MASRRVVLLLALFFCTVTFTAIASRAQQDAPKKATAIAAAAQQSSTKKITILMLNDVYQESPVDKGARGGFARVATLRKEIMAKQPNTIFLFAGDTLSPSVASRTFRGRQMIAAWNAIGLNYATLGNHEFDFGPTVLQQRIAESRFKWVCANVIDKRTGKVWNDLDPYVIKDVGGVKLGIIGLLTPDTVTSSRPGPTIEITNPCSAAKKYVPEMRAKGAQVIVALTHLEFDDDKDLAHCVPIDLIVGGHEHVVLNSVAHGTPIFKAGSDARNLGRIDVEYSESENKIRGIDWELIPVTDQIADEPAVSLVVADFEGKLNIELDQPAGETSVILDATQANNRSRETNLGDLIADAYRAETGAEIALYNGGAVRSNQTYGPGKLTKRDVISILPFENPIVVLEVEGSTIRSALEHGVAAVEVKSDGRFPQVSGITFNYDISKPAGARTSNILVGGKPLVDGKKYKLATTPYVMNGGDGYDMFKTAKVLVKPESGNAESVALMNALGREKVISAKVDGRSKRIDGNAN